MLAEAHDHQDQGRDDGCDRGHHLGVSLKCRRLVRERRSCRRRHLRPAGQDQFRRIRRLGRLGAEGQPGRADRGEEGRPAHARRRRPTTTTFKDPLPHDDGGQQRSGRRLIRRCAFRVDERRLLSPAQLRAALWAGTGSRVHAVIDGLVVPGIAGAAARRRHRRLGLPAARRAQRRGGRAGALPGRAEARARRSPTGCSTRRRRRIRAGACSFDLVAAAAAGARALPLDRRGDSRPDGERRAWRWYDPEVLRASSCRPCSPASSTSSSRSVSRSSFRPPMRGPGWRCRQGVLATDTRPLMAAGPVNARCCA